MLGNKLTDKIPTWVGDYVGIPFDKYNCWQLVCLIYKQRFKIKLCDYGNEYIDSLDKENIKKIYDRELKIWHPIEMPSLGDVIVLKVMGQPWHAGLMVSKQFMLHTERHLESVIESYNGTIWKNKIIGYYRYRT